MYKADPQSYANIPRVADVNCQFGLEFEGMMLPTTHTLYICLPGNLALDSVGYFLTFLLTDNF